MLLNTSTVSNTNTGSMQCKSFGSEDAASESKLGDTQVSLKLHGVLHPHMELNFEINTELNLFFFLKFKSIIQQYLPWDFKKYQIKQTKKSLEKPQIGGKKEKEATYISSELGNTKTTKSLLDILSGILQDSWPCCCTSMELPWLPLKTTAVSNHHSTYTVLKTTLTKD